MLWPGPELIYIYKIDLKIFNHASKISKEQSMTIKKFKKVEVTRKMCYIEKESANLIKKLGAGNFNAGLRIIIDEVLPRLRAEVGKKC